MGGPGSGRKPYAEREKYTPILSQKDRTTRRREIADYAVEHGVRLTSDKFGVSDTLVYMALSRFKLRARRELPQVIRRNTLEILRRLYVDGADVAVVAAEFKVTLKTVQTVRHNAICAGFVFDSNTEGTNE